MTSYQCFVVTLGLDGTVVKLRAVKVSRTVIGLPTAKKQEEKQRQEISSEPRRLWRRGWKQHPLVCFQLLDR